MLSNTIKSFLVIATSASLINAAPQALHKRSVEVINQCVNSGQVALTFDDGFYQYETTAANNLNGGKGTFFLNGNNYNCIYDHAEEMKSLYDQGHVLASHTWSHPHLNSLSWDQVHDELWKVEEAFIKILGVKPKYFRPPYGEYNDNVLAVLDNRGYSKMFLWSDDTSDANGATVDYSKSVYDSVANSYPEPHLVLEHSVIQTTPEEAIPYAVAELNGKGYQLVSVQTCIDDQDWPYVYVGEPQARDASWTC